jgi:hypothetical protein
MSLPVNTTKVLWQINLQPIQDTKPKPRGETLGGLAPSLPHNARGYNIKSLVLQAWVASIIWARWVITALVVKTRPPNGRVPIDIHRAKEEVSVLADLRVQARFSH